MNPTLNQPPEMQERYDSLPQEIKELFEYDTIGVVLKNIALQFGLNKTQAKLLRMEVELVLYFFLPSDGLKERLQESLSIESERAGQIVDQLENDLFIIVKPGLELANKIFSGEEVEEVSLQAPDSLVTPLPKAAPNQPAAPASPQKTSQPGIRTYASDVAENRAHGSFRQPETEQETRGDGEEPVYRSSQDDIIN